MPRKNTAAERTCIDCGVTKPMADFVNSSGHTARRCKRCYDARCVMRKRESRAAKARVDGREYNVRPASPQERVCAGCGKAFPSDMMQPYNGAGEPSRRCVPCHKAYTAERKKKGHAPSGRRRNPANIAYPAISAMPIPWREDKVWRGPTGTVLYSVRTADLSAQR